MKGMDDNQRDHLNKLSLIYEQRLKILELQAANFGLSVPPHVVVEIGDLQSKISSIYTDLNLDAKFLYNTNTSFLQKSNSAKIVVLFISADPSDAVRLRLGQELREIRDNLQRSKERDNFLLESRESVRPGDITQAIFDVEPQIVHFSGHGMSTGELCFENLEGKTQSVQPDALANLFKLVSKQVGCVVLNACYSEIQARAIAEHIPFVIGMNQAIGDKAAIAFAVGFYKALGAGRPFEDAYKFACVEIQLQSIPEHLTPVLKLRSEQQNFFS
jgi:hypothetical protein